MLILISGGVKNGKSTFGENLCMHLTSGPLLYIATMYHNSNDSEINERIHRHRLARSGKGFTTFEKYTDLQSLNITGYTTALLECLPNLLANEMFLSHKNRIESETYILNGINCLNSKLENLVVITNEIFQDGCTYSDKTAEYIQCLGRLNSLLAKFCNEAYEVVCGIPLRLK